MIVVTTVLGIVQEIAYKISANGSIEPKFGQNMSIRCKLKVIKAEPTKWFWKKIIRIEKKGG